LVDKSNELTRMVSSTTPRHDKQNKQIQIKEK
jgi:hypothetical protein